MAMPEYEDMEEPLLCYIFFNGGKTYSVRPADTYDPLADYFGLSRDERTRPRPDGHSGSHWQNRVQRIRLDRGSEASRDLNRLLDSPDGGESSLENIFLSFTSSEAVLCVARPKMKWWSLPLWSHGFESVDLCPFSLFFVHAQPSALPLHSIRYVVSAYIIKVDPLLKLVPMPRQRRAWNECAF